jgi:hypothetical protein
VRYNKINYEFAVDYLIKVLVYVKLPHKKINLAVEPSFWRASARLKRGQCDISILLDYVTSLFCANMFPKSLRQKKKLKLQLPRTSLKKPMAKQELPFALCHSQEALIQLVGIEQKGVPALPYIFKKFVHATSHHGGAVEGIR